VSWNGFKLKGSPAWPRIIHANRKLRAETLPLAFRNSVFMLYTGRMFHRFLDKLELDGRAQLRHLQLNLAALPSDACQQVTMLLKDCKNLKNVSIALDNCALLAERAYDGAEFEAFAVMVRSLYALEQPRIRIICRRRHDECYHPLEGRLNGFIDFAISAGQIGQQTSPDRDRIERQFSLEACSCLEECRKWKTWAELPQLHRFPGDVCRIESGGPVYGHELGQYVVDVSRIQSQLAGVALLWGL
jgi:hypothetical protein